MTQTAFIFDLDGVIVDTARFHFIAWKMIADNLGIPFSEKENEDLKGVSRVDSLKKILKMGNKTLSEDEFNRLLVQKNEDYLTRVDTLDENDILPGVVPFLSKIEALNIPIALGSASKNARKILTKIGLKSRFRVIVDGNLIQKPKPNPEVFLKAAELLQVSPKNCIVFEDSTAGIQAANTATMTSVGIGNASVLNQADFVYDSFKEISDSALQMIKNFKK
ncbi:MAG TPA: beta-phosphoglucomutase [Flavobacteriaceae bacterium]|nr:beta-phosphoglucomutase [Flavobacteriaceae bacterium]